MRIVAIIATISAAFVAIFATSCDATNVIPGNFYVSGRYYDQDGILLPGSGPQGPQGEQGPQGIQGIQGPAGNNGTNGTNGTNGYTWYSGSGAPDVGTGVNGDYYFRTTTSDVYLKSGGSWSIIANIKGATGDTGATGADGADGADGQDATTTVVENGSMPAAGSSYRGLIYVEEGVDNTGGSIDIGSAASDYNSTGSASNTLIDTNNPVANTGTITSIEIWANTSLSNCKVGVFYLVSGTTYKCRSAATLGSVTSGSKQTFGSLSLGANSGDVIGVYFTGGTLEVNTSGGTAGAYYYAGDVVTVNSQQSFSSWGANIVMAVYGTGNYYNGTDDVARVCLRDEAGNYSWVVIAP